jgi:hypothetical protein
MTKMIGEVSRGEKMALRGTDPESCHTEHTLVYEEKYAQANGLIKISLALSLSFSHSLSLALSLSILALRKVSRSRRGTTRAKYVQGTPAQRHISPSILVYEDARLRLDTFPESYATKFTSIRR